MSKDKANTIEGISLEEFRADMEDLKKSNLDQAIYAKKQFSLTMISTIAVLIVCAAIIFAGYIIFPKVNTLLDSAVTSLENINEISKELTALDYEGLMDDVGGLVMTTEDDLAQTMEKINSIDFEGLNKGISDLTTVIEPLSRFFGAFN